MADYGINILSSLGGTLFTTLNAGRGTYQVSKGTVAAGTALNVKTGDILVFNLGTVNSGNSFWVRKTTVLTGTDQTANFAVRFQIERQYGTQVITSVNYAILRDMSQNTASGTYGVKCYESAGAYAGPVSFDSRLFGSSQGEITIDPNNVYTSPFSHKTRWHSTIDTNNYYDAGPLDFSSITYYVREYGILFSNMAIGATAFYSSVFGATITGPGVFVCNRFTTFGSISHPANPFGSFSAIPTPGLGAYDPQ